ncbi:MAG: NmrA family NAD(P)-binding protein [Pirellulaceae bacterium]|nr:NmrA family NAD(P)-binding protein [Pirellulaceae bacterium]
MASPQILIQLDSDPHPSVFDAVVAIDSGIDHLLQYGQVEPTNVRALVHGAMFTRGPAQLASTAIFIGGSNVTLGEAIAAEVAQAFFGPVRVSVMLDGNGSSTTAAAAVLCAARHVELSTLDALVLGGTGPVGQRVARLLVKAGAKVRLASRDAARAELACQQLSGQVDVGANQLLAVGTSDAGVLQQQLSQASAVFGCGAAGAQLLSQQQLSQASELKVAIDLNAVPPEGLEGIAATDKAVARGGRLDYGAIGVGGLKMKIHRESIRTLFSRNDLVLDAEQIFEIGRQLESATTV